MKTLSFEEMTVCNGGMSDCGRAWVNLGVAYVGLFFCSTTVVFAGLALVNYVGAIGGLAVNC